MDLYTDLFITDKRYFSFNGNIYRTNIDYAKNRSGFVVGYPDSVDVLFAFGADVEALSPISPTDKIEVCKCHEKYGKTLFKGVSEDKKRFLDIQQKHLPALYKKITAGMKKGEELLYDELLERLSHKESITVVTKLNMKRYANILRTAIMVEVVAILTDSGNTGVQVVKDRLRYKKGKIRKGKVEEAALGISFVIWDPVVQRWIDKNTAKLVQDISNQTQASIRAVIDAKVQGGLRIGDAARLIKPLIGLNRVQGQAVINYEQRLIQSGLSPSKVTTKVAQYSNKLHILRAQTIARTESRAAVSAGQLMGYAQSYVTEVEFTASAGACQVCLGFDRRVYPIGKASLAWQSIPREPGIATGRWGGFRQEGFKEEIG